MIANFTSIKHKTDFFGYISFLKILPLVIINIKNWKQFLSSYSDSYKGPVFFRDGLKLNVEDSSDSSSISTSFFRKDYGDLNQNWMSVVDIGAHKGFFTTYVATKLPNAKVFSYEPIKTSFLALQKHVRENKMLNVKIFNLGVAEKSGAREINISNSSTDNSFYKEIGSDMIGKTTITCTTMLDILKSNNLKRLDLLKLDCEGAEFEILMSSNKATLDKVVEIRMEYHDIDKDKNITKLKKFLKAKGFTVSEHRLSKNPRIGYAQFIKTKKI